MPLSSMPCDEFDTNGCDAAEFHRQETRTGGEPLPEESGKVPAFEGVHLLVLKGFMCTLSMGLLLRYYLELQFPLAILYLGIGSRGF